MQVIAGADFSRRRRGPFLSPVELMVLATMVAGLLLLLFPGRNYEDPKHLDRPDHLAIAYLNMLLRAHPEDARARLLLAQHQMGIGQLEDARQSLAPLLGRPDEIGSKAEVISLKLERARYVAMEEDDPERAALETSLRKVALKLIPRTNRPEDLADLADFVLGQNMPAQAAAAYRRLAEIDRPKRISWLEKGARWTEAGGQPGTAARIYLQAALEANDVGKDPKTGARLGREALRALRAANEGRSGLATARPLVDRFPLHLPLLDEAVTMAVAAGDLSTARTWGEQRVAAAGGSDQALRDQIDILTKAGDPEGALRVAKQLHARMPGNSALRKQMAQLARWSGKPEESLDHWVWLANRGSEEARVKALELARALSDTDREVEMLELRMKRARRMAAPTVPDFENLRRRLGNNRSPRVEPPSVPAMQRRRPRQPTGSIRTLRRRCQKTASPSPTQQPASSASSRAAAPTATSITPPSTPGTQTPSSRSKAAAPRKGDDFELAELIALADALETKGLPERAIANMDSFRFNFAEKPEYWVRLARLYEQINQLERALACHEQLARLKAMTLDDAIRQAQLLWRLQRPDASLTRLIALRGQARDTDRNYWTMLGDLSWRLENDLMAAEAYAVLWKNEKNSDVGDRLWRALESAGRRDEAVRVAAEAFDKLGQPGFLVSAVDLALKRGDRDTARSLFAKVEGKESAFGKESQFWFQRAMLAVHDDRPADAERDFRRVLTVDARNEDAHVEWLTLAVHVQDRSMARRALDHWGEEAEDDEGNWYLLADAYQLLGETTQYNRFRKLARAAKARERAASGRPMTPEEEVEEAIERKDRVAIESRLRAHGNALSLPMRVAGLRELGRDDDAWALLESAGLTEDRRLMSSENAAELIADVRDLRENYLSGAWAWGGANQFGPLEVRGAGARIEIRKRALTFGLEGVMTDLRTKPLMEALLARGSQEKRVELIARLREPFGETSLRAGGQFLPEGYRPTFTLEQLFGTGLSGSSELRLRGAFNEVPAHSPLLRVGALRDGGSADLLLAFKSRLELGAHVSGGRFVTRGRLPLTTEVATKGEVAYRLPLGSAYVRPRADAFRSWAKPLADIPVDLMPLLKGMSIDPDDVLVLEYDSVGAGLTIASAEASVGEGRGPHVTFRYHLDGWAGYLMPAYRPSYAAEVGIGLVFARHQELSVEGYFFSDVGSASGERYAGASLNYTLRWFR